MLQLIIDNKAEILGAWVVLEQVLAQTKIVKANSTLQLILNIFKKTA